MDAQGRLFIGDELNHAVRIVATQGRVSTLIGTGQPGRATIGHAAVGSAVDDPESVLVMPDGGVLIADGNNGRVLRLSEDGRIHLFAGRGDMARCSSRW